MVRAIAIAGFLLLAAGAAAIAWAWYPWVFSASYTIRAATGPIGSDWQKFLEAFKHEMEQERPRLRLALEETVSLQESAEALQSGDVDLAIVRSDHPAAASGGTIVIVRRIPLVIMVPAQSSVKAMTDLVGKKIAVLEGTAEGDPLLTTVMELYGLQSSNIVKASPADVGALLREKRVAAIFAMAPDGPGAITEAVKAIAKATRKPPRFLDLEEAKAIAARNPVYQEMDIPQGAFVVAPAIPGEEVTTVAVTVRLVARSSMLNYVAGEITRLLLATRAKLAATVPTAGEIEAPDTDKKGVLPVHPGAAAYLDGEQESLFEQAMTQLFNISIIGGILGSIAFGVNTLWRRHRAEETQKTVARLPAMLREAKSVPLGRLDEMEDELDTLSGWLLDRFVREHIAPERISGVAAIISEIRLAIERRRKVA